MLEPVVLRASRSRCAWAASASGVALGDVDLDLAARDDREQLVGHRLHRLARRDVGDERLPRHVERALRRRATTGANGGTDARGVAEARHQAERPQAVERLVPGVLADRVVDDLDALAAGDLLDARGEVLGAVVDREGGAVVARERAFLVAARRADQLQAERLRPLAGDQADAAGRGVPDDEVARLERLLRSARA